MGNATGYIARSLSRLTLRKVTYPVERQALVRCRFAGYSFGNIDLTDKTDEKIERLQEQVKNETKEFVKILSFLASKIEALYETIYDISPEHAEVLSVSERRLLETWRKKSN